MSVNIQKRTTIYNRTEISNLKPGDFFVELDRDNTKLFYILGFTDYVAEVCEVVETYNREYRSGGLTENMPLSSHVYRVDVDITWSIAEYFGD